MDIIKVLKEAIPKINKETLKELDEIGHAILEKDSDDLENVISKSFEEIGVTDSDAGTTILLFLIGKHLGKQEAVKEQKIFIQGDY